MSECFFYIGYLIPNKYVSIYEKSSDRLNDKLFDIVKYDNNYSIIYLRKKHIRTRSKVSFNLTENLYFNNSKSYLEKTCDNEAKLQICMKTYVTNCIKCIEMCHVPRCFYKLKLGTKLYNPYYIFGISNVKIF